MTDVRIHVEYWITIVAIVFFTLFAFSWFRVGSHLFRNREVITRSYQNISGVFSTLDAHRNTEVRDFNRACISLCVGVILTSISIIWNKWYFGDLNNVFDTITTCLLILNMLSALFGFFVLFPVELHPADQFRLSHNLLCVCSCLKLPADIDAEGDKNIINWSKQLHKCGAGCIIIVSIIVTFLAYLAVFSYSLYSNKEWSVATTYQISIIILCFLTFISACIFVAMDQNFQPNDRERKYIYSYYRRRGSDDISGSHITYRPITIATEASFPCTQPHQAMYDAVITLREDLNALQEVPENYELEDQIQRTSPCSLYFTNSKKSTFPVIDASVVVWTTSTIRNEQGSVQIVVNIQNAEKSLIEKGQYLWVDEACIARIESFVEPNIIHLDRNVFLGVDTKFTVRWTPDWNHFWRLETDVHGQPVTEKVIQTEYCRYTHSSWCHILHEYFTVTAVAMVNVIVLLSVTWPIK